NSPRTVSVRRSRRVRRWEPLLRGFEIDRDDGLAVGDPELSHRDMACVLLVRLERRAVRKEDHKPRVVRPAGPYDVAANLQVDHPVYVSKAVEAFAVLRAHRLIRAALVFEHHQVNEHHSSSPSMSSSAMSTTTL